MKNSLNISIQKPCHEDFNNFEKTKSGGFCNSCSKEVIDFTTMSNKEIVVYFTTTNKNTCGRFYKDQLKDYHHHRNKKKLKKHSFISAISFSLISLFSGASLTAQEKKSDTISTIPLNKSKKILRLNSHTLKGVVLSGFDNYPLPGVSVVLKNSIVGTDSDFDGNFKLKNIKEGDIISVYSIGFKTQEIVVQKNQTFLKVVMQEDTSILGGLVVAGEVDVKATYKTKRSFWQRIKSIF